METYKHLFGERRESRRVWRAFNEYMERIGHQHRVSGYEELTLQYGLLPPISLKDHESRCLPWEAEKLDGLGGVIYLIFKSTYPRPHTQIYNVHHVLKFESNKSF